jgi:hypothetical protein
MLTLWPGAVSISRPHGEVFRGRLATLCNPWVSQVQRLTNIRESATLHWHLGSSSGIVELSDVRAVDIANHKRINRYVLADAAANNQIGSYPAVTTRRLL